MAYPQELEPRMDVAEQLYPQVLDQILAYTKLVDDLGDTDLQAYANLEKQLGSLVAKDMRAYNLAEWWEQEGAEVLAFRIALPDPPRLSRKLSATEIEAILLRLSASQFVHDTQGGDFALSFSLYLDSWYRQLLKLNAPYYGVQWFNRQKGPDGSWFEYTLEEKVALFNLGKLRQ